MILAALVVTVVVVLALLIAGQDDTPSARSAPVATSKPVPKVHPAAAVKPVQRLSGASSNFDSSAGGWLGQNATASSVSTPAHHGAGALQIDGSAVGGSMTVWSPIVSAASGDRYVASAYVRAVTAVRGAKAKLRFINAAGNVTDTETGQQVTDALSSWTPLPDVAGIAPKGTAQVQLGVS